MSIKIEVSQRGEYPEGDGKVVYFAKDTTAEFSLDGNADNAQMMAGYALSGIIRAHYGDTLLIVIHLNGKMVARWIGEATDYAADEFEGFMGGRATDFWPYARRIKDHASMSNTGLLQQARGLASVALLDQASFARKTHGEKSTVAALFVAKADRVRRGKHDGDSCVRTAISQIIMADSSRREFACTEQ